MPDLTPEGARMLDEVARRHGVGFDAASALLAALVRGGGAQAQFNHPDLGGMGQWSQGGMIMIGDMFNHGLKHRVDALCNELAGLLRSQSALVAEPRPGDATAREGGEAFSLFAGGAGTPGRWWPAELGDPASSGAQNDMRYAFFPGPRRLAIEESGRLRVYDSGEHRLSGFSQQQSGDRSVSFTSQFGPVRIADLPLVSPQEQRAPAPPAPPPAASAVPPPPPAAAPPGAAADILRTLEGLAELRRKDILTEAEFAAKKAELLSRL